MTLEVDPGRNGEPLEEGATIPLSQTEPNVQPDQILAALDGDTRAYLTLLLEGGAEGLGGRGRELSAGLRRFEPLGRYLAQIGNALTARRRNIARTITSFRALGEELGKTDTRLSEWVSAQNAALGAFANQEASIRETLRELPSTLRRRPARPSPAARPSRTSSGRRSEALIPAAQAFEPAQQSAQAFFTETYEPIRDQIRPFTREVRRPVRHLKQASRPLGGDHQGPRRLARGPQPALQRARLQPVRAGGGLPVLARLAQPQHQQHIPDPGRQRSAPARQRAAVV